MKKILIVEDDMIIAHFLKRLLQTLGYEKTEVVVYGEEVLDKVRQMRPDMILMDIMLRGDKDGIEAVIDLAADNSIPRIPVIYLTGNTDKATYARAQQTGPHRAQHDGSDRERTECRCIVASKDTECTLSRVDAPIRPIT